ncbi:MAG: HK97 gp10 family phage protein [Candidatus Bathyarchaeia archaeon]
MAVEVNIEVDAEEVLQALQRLDEAMLRQVREQLERWAMEVREYARALAPARTGYLRGTIYAKVQGWVAEIGAEASYAMFVEFGTHYMQARPYLNPALQEFLPTLEQVILEAIDKAKAEAEL